MPCSNLCNKLRSTSFERSEARGDCKDHPVSTAARLGEGLGGAGRQFGHRRAEDVFRRREYKEPAEEEIGDHTRCDAQGGGLQLMARKVRGTVIRPTRVIQLNAPPRRQLPQKARYCRNQGLRGVLRNVIVRLST